MKMSKEKEISPVVIIPNKDFLIGCLYGFNAARKRLEEKPQPLFCDDSELKEVTNKDFYLGSWFEITCKCGMFYSFDNANQIPNENLQCQQCGNILIFYNVFNPEFWKIGTINFV